MIVNAFLSLGFEAQDLTIVTFEWSMIPSRTSRSLGSSGSAGGSVPSASSSSSLVLCCLSGRALPFYPVALHDDVTSTPPLILVFRPQATRLVLRVAMGDPLSDVEGYVFAGAFLGHLPVCSII